MRFISLSDLLHFGMTVTAGLFHYCCRHSYRGQQRALNATSGLNIQYVNSCVNPFNFERTNLPQITGKAVGYSLRC